MRSVKIIVCLFLLIAPTAVQADQIAKAQTQIEAAKAAIEAFSRKSNDNKLAAKDLEAARSIMKRSEEAVINNRTMFGLGDISPETASSVKQLTDLIDMHLTLGQSRIDAAKAAEELKVLSSQVAKVRGKVKVFEDRKAELEKLRSIEVKHEAVLKDLEALKLENSRLIEKEQKLIDGQKGLVVELDYLKAEMAKRSVATSLPVTPGPEAAPKTTTP
jgi:hypothetical protein